MNVSISTLLMIFCIKLMTISWIVSKFSQTFFGADFVFLVAEPGLEFSLLKFEHNGGLPLQPPSIVGGPDPRPSASEFSLGRWRFKLFFLQYIKTKTYRDNFSGSFYIQNNKNIQMDDLNCSSCIQIFKNESIQRDNLNCPFYMHTE